MLVGESHHVDRATTSSIIHTNKTYSVVKQYIEMSGSSKPSSLCPKCPSKTWQCDSEPAWTIPGAGNRSSWMENWWEYLWCFSHCDMSKSPLWRITNLEKIRVKVYFTTQRQMASCPYGCNKDICNPLILWIYISNNIVFFLPCFKKIAMSSLKRSDLKRPPLRHVWKETATQHRLAINSSQQFAPHLSVKAAHSDTYL